ncbi:MAG: penicillin-binding protein activator [Acidiferrobacterales bacterium]|nr:penicillin-binding protein activator [Acidiferrobacterales bacterium]
MHLELHSRKKHKSLSLSAVISYSAPIYKHALIFGALLITTSCATQAPAPSIEAGDANASNTAPEEQSTQQTDQNGDKATPLFDRDINIERAEYYQNLAENGSELEQINAQLSAAENYIQALRYLEAEQQIVNLSSQNLSKQQRDRLAIINDYISYERKDYYGALSRLNTILLDIKATLRQSEIEEAIPSDQKITATDNNERLTNTITPSVIRQKQLSTQQVDALLLSSFCYQQIGNWEAAIDALLTREGALVGAARAETTRYIWQVINQIELAQRQSIIATSPKPLVVNRLEQSLQGQVRSRDVAPQQFSQWRDNIETTAEKRVIETGWNPSSPRKIAVLLPLTSKFNKAAQAVMDGIKFENQRNSSPYRPELQFYDIGSDIARVPQFYNAAVQNGADFIIGPLGTDYANQISRQAGLRAPTILLGGDSSIGGSMTRLAKSPELEGIRVAERALKDGHINAAILSSDSAYNRRVVDAFSAYWLQAGGKINAVVNYDKTQYDHSAQLKQMFDIVNSESRYTRLSNTLGFKPKFSAHQRNDLDFIFMLADNQTGRIVRPQINFFSGSKIPVYSTSDLFNGIPDNINNIDLDNTLFPIMPWVYQSKDTSSYAGQLNMLFALGADAYLVAGNFSNLNQNSDNALNGNTGQISIKSNSEIHYQPLWAQFSEGEATLLTPYQGKLTPTTPLNSRNGTNTANKKGIYNDQNWDTGKSRRKTSP